MNNYINYLFNNLVFKILMIIIVLDVFLGSLRALRERKWNSTVGIDGMIRKTGMIGSIAFVGLIDCLVEINLVAFVPNILLEFLHIEKVGISDFWGITFILYEITSVLKNAVKIKLPIFKNLQKYLEKLLKTMTSELDGKEGGKNG